ncbi:MAG: hypothetical protein HY081_10125 [Gammaproteobacteria bacterium]|nr:hypothetical protein [Gammaproteobacteria bacterium]
MVFRVEPKSLEGRRLERTIVASAEHSASSVQMTASEKLPVMPTGQLLELIESTAFDVVNPFLEPGHRTVGTGLELRHFAATPETWRVTATVTLRAINGRKCIFDVAVRDQLEQVCTGAYFSYVVNTERFRSDVENKKYKLLSPVA